MSFLAFIGGLVLGFLVSILICGTSERVYFIVKNKKDGDTCVGDDGIQTENRD